MRKRLRKLSIQGASWRAQISVAFALMTVIPFLTFGYFLTSYLIPTIATKESVALVVVIDLILALAGFVLLRHTIGALSDFRDYMARVAGGDLSDAPSLTNGPDVTSIASSMEAIVARLRDDRDRLQRVSEELEDKVRLRTAELENVNAKLERELEERAKAEQALRDSNMQLSDALTNVTTMQRKMIEHARLSALGQMASGIAHDFNNALMPMLGLTELLLSCPDMLDDRRELVDTLQHIRSAANDAKEVVKRLREFYTTDGNVEFAPVDVNAVIEECVVLTQPRWKEELSADGISITMETRLADVPPIQGNEPQLRDALTNIILNAADAMPENGAITVSSAADNDSVSIMVADAGVGMPEDVRKQCFDPFFSTKEGTGTGIGLTMTLGIVESHGGSVKIESEEGKGTTVTIALPLPAPDPVRDIPAATQNREPVDPLKVLVIDDDSRSSGLLNRYLRADDHTVEIADTGKAGLERFAGSPFDLVITDRAMPDMSGDDVSASLRDTNAQVPVIMLTGFGQMMKDKGQQPSAVDLILSKPVTPLELRKAIHEVLNPKPNTS